MVKALAEEIASLKLNREEEQNARLKTKRVEEQKEEIALKERKRVEEIDL